MLIFYEPQYTINYIGSWTTCNRTHWDVKMEICFCYVEWGMHRVSNIENSINLFTLKSPYANGIFPAPWSYRYCYVILCDHTLHSSKSARIKSSCAAQEYWHQYMLDIIKLYFKMHCLSMVWASEVLNYINGLFNKALYTRN